MGDGIAGGIKTAHAAAILAIPAAMRVTGSTNLPFLQPQPAGSVTGAAFTRAFAVGAFSVGFRHCSLPFCLKISLWVERQNRAPISLIHPLILGLGNDSAFALFFKTPEGGGAHP